MSTQNIHNVLFTGGLDSTYRLCQLALDENVVIQPIYILFPEEGNTVHVNIESDADNKSLFKLFKDIAVSTHVRPELERELKAQNEVLDYLKNCPNVKATFLPMKRVHRDEIPKDNRIMDLEVLLSSYNFGWQYLYIAELSNWFPHIELCHEFLPIKLVRRIHFKNVNDMFYCDMETTNNDFSILFRYLSWPILGVSRQKMVSDLKAWGFYDVLQHIWFCYKSVNDKPCGMCESCTIKIEQGLDCLFDAESLHRYYGYRVAKTFSVKCANMYKQFVMYNGNIPFEKINSIHDRKRLSTRLAVVNKIDSLNIYKLKRILKKYPNMEKAHKMMDKVYWDIMRS